MESLADLLNYGARADPAKITGSRSAFCFRGRLARRHAQNRALSARAFLTDMALCACC